MALATLLMLFIWFYLIPTNLWDDGLQFHVSTVLASHIHSRGQLGNLFLNGSISKNLNIFLTLKYRNGLRGLA